MKMNLGTLKPEEKASFALRSLYEKYGYKKHKVSIFEEYSLYLKYKSFLKSDEILTFTNLDGKLLALKPDITLSIIKTIPAEASTTEKLYYTETVYRPSKESKTFKEINQMGLEYLGNIDRYAVAETVFLANQSLAEISPNYILELGHIGFVLSFLDTIGLEMSDKQDVLRFIAAKSQHEIISTAKRLGLDAKTTDTLTAICTLSGEFCDILQKAKNLCVTEKMTVAVNELEDIYNTVAQGNDNVKLDLTLLNDTAFYDGILLAGYLQGLSRPVLSGGRYDSMMKNLGKKSGAIGFALYLDELERLATEKPVFDVDIVIFTNEKYNPKELLKTVNDFIIGGETVKVETQKETNIRYKQGYTFGAGGLEKC